MRSLEGEGWIMKLPEWLQTALLVTAITATTLGLIGIVVWILYKQG